MGFNNSGRWYQEIHPIPFSGILLTVLKTILNVLVVFSVTQETCYLWDIWWVDQPKDRSENTGGLETCTLFETFDEINGWDLNDPTDKKTMRFGKQHSQWWTLLNISDNWEQQPITAQWPCDQAWTFPMFRFCMHATHVHYSLKPLSIMWKCWYFLLKCCLVLGKVAEHDKAFAEFAHGCC